jgi:hypothetical protein
LHQHFSCEVIQIPSYLLFKHKTGWSKESIKWLEYTSIQHQCYIQHIGNSEKEYYDIWTRSPVDGYCSETNTVYEFLGCFWHGYPKCFSPNLRHPKIQRDMSEILEKTNKKLSVLRQHYQAEFVWECDWKNQNISFNEYQTELCNIILDREMIFGGRSKVFQPYGESDEFNSIQYHDVTSLYPTICTHDELPIGFPIRYFGLSAQQQLPRLHPQHPQRIFGYVRCKVLPSTTDRLGLLPCRKENKLMFDLYPKIGTWFADELYFAKFHGCRILEIYEILHWNENARSRDYMKGYMSFFLRQKQEAEGWPNHIITNEQKLQFIEYLYMMNGNVAKMRSNKVNKNPVLRQLAKLYLNCLWGKFGQSPMSQRQEYIHNTSHFLSIQYDPSIKQETVRFRHIKGNSYHVLYEQELPYLDINPHYSVWLAAAVPAWGRIRLHKQMMVIGPERIIYCDTDSIIFYYQRYLPTLAKEGLGNWANEEKEHEITHFYGLAPKSYQYCLSNGKNKIKTKGVSMTIHNKEIATTSCIEKLIQICLWENLGYITEESPLWLDHFTIIKNSTNSKYAYGAVFSRYSKKQMKAVYTKRQLVCPWNNEEIQQTQEKDFYENFPLSLCKRIVTLPFGYETV